jgi:hypothetical protein
MSRRSVNVEEPSEYTIEKLRELRQRSMVLSTTLKHIMDGYSGRLEVFNDHFDDGITDDMAKLLDDIERLQHESRCKLNDLVTKISKRHGKPEVDQP